MHHPLDTKRSIEARLKRGLALLVTVSGLLLVILAACSGTPETVEVTRIVTETIIETVEIEGEAVEVEVTRVVTETVIETVEMEGEAEPPSATGSEGDAGPLPPPPDNGPKVANRGGDTQTDGIALETAVTLRANQNNGSATAQPDIIAAAGTVNAVERQKWCQQFEAIYKKRCS